MANEIKGEPRNISEVFRGKRYYIDFYQREYKWTKETVKILLDDIFYKFDPIYKNKSNLDITAEAISEYPWYYLNTYITNDNNGKAYIVDGQQRLTTITLILIQLFHIAKKYDDKLVIDLTSQLVYTTTPFGYEYSMGDRNRSHILEKLRNKNIKDIDICDKFTTSEKNMLENSKEIALFLEKKLDNQHKFKTFVTYFMHRVFLIELLIDKTDDVPMVFEVINDRGVKLKPYEVLKGKILSKIAKGEVNTYCDIWDEAFARFEHEENLSDEFLRTYFKATLASNRNEAKDFDGDYHKKILDRLKLNNPSDIKSFIQNNIKYYAKLYSKINERILVLSPQNQYNYFNELTDMGAYKQIALKACKINDEREDEKITEIAKLWDRHYVLSTLNGCYNSNELQEDMYEISNKIENIEVSEYKKIFDELLLNKIKTEKATDNIASVYNYKYFQANSYSYLQKRFLRYLFARIEYYFYQNSLTKLDKNTIENYVRSNGVNTAFHIEHILSHNNENKDLFDSEEEFEEKRNMLGGLLLLKGKDNKSSGNELYKDKLKTYMPSLFWNETLCESFYHCNTEATALIDTLNEGFKKDGIAINNKIIKIEPIQTFTEQSLEERTRILFELIKIIWE